MLMRPHVQYIANRKLLSSMVLYTLYSRAIMLVLDTLSLFPALLVVLGVLFAIEYRHCRGQDLHSLDKDVQ